MKNLIATVAVSLLVTSQVLAQIQPVQMPDDKGDGSVDWGNRFIVATGIGAPNPDLPEGAQRAGAERAATFVAIRNALETIKGIYLSSSTTIKNFMTENDVIRSSVSGFVKGFEKEGRTRYMSDGSVEITMKIPIDGIGGLSDKLFGESLGATPAITKFEGKKSRKAVVFSGLIIDCRGLKVKPALSPRILDENGREIYGSAYVSREWAIKHGIVGYAKDITGAVKLDRIGKTPGKVKAVKTHGQNNTDVVLSSDDAEDIRSASDNLKFLSECRVVFVID